MDILQLQNIQQRASSPEEYLRAERVFKKYFETHEPCHNSLFLYGTLCIQRTEFGRGAEYIKEALKLKPDLLPGYVNLIAAYRALGMIERAIEQGEAAIKKILPHYHGTSDKHYLKNICSIYVNTGSSLVDFGDRERAEKLLRKAVSIQPDDPDANWNLSLALLCQGKFEEGWKYHDWGFRARERLSRPFANEIPAWTGEPLSGKSILVWGEQGIGDEILFANCIKDVINEAKQVYLDCHPRLYPIFKRSFPEAVCQGSRKTQHDGLFDQYDIDYQIPMGSLGHFYRDSKEKFPKEGYLKANPERVEYWKNRIGGQYRVGLSWRGGSKRTQIERRSMELRELALTCMHLVKGDPDIQFVNLQYGGVFQEVDQLERSLGWKLHNFDFALEDYEETANLTASCDLVISVITAIVHLAGALDVPTWCLTPQAPPWKFTQGEDIAWHPSVRQFHQKERHNWKPVLTDVSREFKKWVKEKRSLSLA